MLANPGCLGLKSPLRRDNECFFLKEPIMKKCLMSMVVLVTGMMGLGMAQGAILHNIPGGDFSTLAGEGAINDQFGMPAGYWQMYNQQNSSVNFVGTVGASDRHVELGTGWSWGANAYLGYVDTSRPPRTPRGRSSRI
jgi:hypothetical protein